MFAPFWRATPKIVVSRDYAGDEWTSRVIRDDLAWQVATLRAQDGRDMLHTGGATLAAALTEHGLIDEYHIAVHPVVLGGGRKVLGQSTERLTMRPVESRIVDNRVVVTHGQRA